MKIKKVEAIREYPTGFDNLQMVSGKRLPGIGVELVANPQDVRPPVTRSIGMRPHRDGFIVDQQEWFHLCE